MAFRPLDPKSSASASSATFAWARLSSRITTRPPWKPAAVAGLSDALYAAPTWISSARVLGSGTGKPRSRNPSMWN